MGLRDTPRRRAAALAALCLLSLVGAAGRVEAASTEEQQQREEYIQRALQQQANPALAGRKERSTGTGFYVSDHALITNYHVVRDCAVMTVESVDDDTESAATLSATDPSNDLALLRTSISGRAIAEIETRPERIDASDLYIVGYPAQGLVVRQATLTPAVGKPTELTGTRSFFHIIADVHPGHSGSPVLDEYGAVVGVMTRAVDTVTTYAKTGKVVTNIGLAVPLAVLSGFLRAHAVPYRRAITSFSLTATERLERGRAFVSHVNCWR